jgi:nitrogen regulatory protein PII
MIPMRMFDKKRIEIIVEAPALHRLTDALEKAGVTGYTILPVLAGSGSAGAWTREGQIGDAGRMVAILCITDPSRVDGVLEGVYRLLSRQIGIVTVADVKVLRETLF